MTKIAHCMITRGSIVQLSCGGGYYEVTPAGSFWRAPGSVTFRRAKAAHRLELARDADGNVIESWSLFITGPKIRTWGFHCPKGFVPWFNFVAKDNTGEVGPGCGE